MALELKFSAQDVKIHSDDTVYQGHFRMRKLSLQHRLFAGGWSEPLTRELFERGDAVGVLPYDPVSDSLIFIGQFRPGAIRGDDSPWMLELIAGVVEDGEVHGLDTEGEDILVHSIPRGEALEMLALGQITNGHTLIALQWLQVHAHTVREKRA